MATINYGRVLVGGLAAGFVANAVDFVTNTYLMADDLQQNAQRLGLDLVHLNSTRVAITWVIVNFVYGTLIVFTYAGFRARFGPGPNTAVAAGLTIFAGATVVLYGFAEMGFFTMPTFIKASFFTAVSTLLASLAGGRVYRE